MQGEGMREPVRIGANVEHSSESGRYRASCTFMGDRGPVTSVGPWRKTNEKALEDAEELQDAYNRGGETEVQKAKVGLLHRAAVEGGTEEGKDESVGLEPNFDGDFLYPTEIEGPSKTSSSLGGYRACVTFPSSAKPTYEGARPRKPVPVKCPWRLGPRARAAAEADARALCEGYEANGEQGMQEKKRDMFKTADADAQAARMGRGKDDTLQNIFQKSTSSSGVAADREDDEELLDMPQEERLEHSLEEDRGRGSDSRGVRAKCFFPSDRINPSGGPSAPIQISGPWRKRRQDAEADIRDLQRAFDEGGLSAANSRRMALLREKEEGPQSEQAPKGELTEEDMAKRYGKGFKLVAGMGFSAGSGLGREGRGLKMPVEAVDADVALATASRHIGLGFADIAGFGLPND